MKPDSRQQKDVIYFREIVFKTRLSQKQIAKRIGVTDRTMRNYLKLGAPYMAQFAVECIVYGVE